MSTAATEAPPEILIPSLPNDIALQCLARVPRQYHPVLAAVSKPIRSLLSSPHFFAVRSSLNCSELLPYLRIHSQSDKTLSWSAVYGRRPNPNSDDNKTNIIIAPVPGLPDDCLDWSHNVAIGPKIYVFGGKTDRLFSTKVWIFDCRFHTWERGPSMPTALGCATKTVVFDGKIYVIRQWKMTGSWADVFDAVAGRWEALPSPVLEVYGKLVLGCAIRGGKVCIWMDKEELRFDPAMKTWEAFESRIGYGLDWNIEMCEVNGVLCCLDGYSGLIKGFDERIGGWKRLKFVNKGMRSYRRNLRMSNVGGRLVILESALLRNLEKTMGVWCVEIEVKKDKDGNLQGEVLWSEMVYSTCVCGTYRWPLLYNCMPVSL
ncbi:F-box/kelch-repeat protein SKIP6 [Morus notabilis]|uniref:F-box/kelch-repeat protein SKIP6 n=1 Tax=Morus notabilis TaxID=981085 RepID=W9SAK3_9ROSA|nr:F-box/kelch-repeat protein SKIP6 [Morus notabilis]EXC19722.1 F-box/kelch-repeat protein SKIP6 [Morus notabilis]